MERLETLGNSVWFDQQHAFSSHREEPLAFKVCDNLYVLSPIVGTQRLSETEQQALNCLRQNGIFVCVTGEHFLPRKTADTGRNIFWLWIMKLAARPEVEKLIALRHYLHHTQDFSQTDLIVTLLEQLVQRYKLMRDASSKTPLAEEAALYEASFLITEYRRFKLDTVTADLIQGLKRKYGPRQNTPWSYLWGVTLPVEDA